MTNLFQQLRSFFIVCFGVLAFLHSGSAKGQMHLESENGTIIFHNINLDHHQIHTEETEAFLLNNFDLNKNHTFITVSSLTDNQGLLHIRYAHRYQAHRIIGSDVICHYRNGILYSINGRLRKPTSSKVDIISRDIAFENAKVKSSADNFKWEFPEEERILKIWKEDSNATYLPEGELVYVSKDFDFKTPLELCYVFEINSDAPLMRKNIFIHAVTGAFWAEEDLLHIADVKGSANTKYRGVKPIITDSTAPGNYRLREAGRGGGIETYDMNNGRSYGAAVDFTDADNYWNNYNANFDEIGGDAHYGAEKTYDYYKQNFNRNSFDNNGAKIRSYVHYGTKYVNAFWNGSVMTYGDGNGTSFTPLTSVDICGHEISHAVTSSTASLIYRNESGALNESFSDIFGNAIEYFADTTQFSWRMGEDIMASANGLRNMANPKTHRDPSTYKGQYWYSGTGDNGGVHTNSGVQNFWFYILTEGATGTNDNGDAYQVDSLGIHKAEQIAYRNLTVYLTSSSDYAEARYYAIQSATDLYGDCSKEVQATTNAWYAAGVGDAYDSSVVIAQFSADTTYCQAIETVQFVNKSVNAKKYLWDFGDGDTSTQNNPSHVYPNQGKYTVTLIAESCYNNNFDTLSKKDYISIDSNQDICKGYLLPKGTWSTVHACDGFIYDHNGEADYQGLLRDTLTIDFGQCDSAQITFEEMDYENKFDSIYVYDGTSTSATLIGGFTGKNLPFGGKSKTLNKGAVTIRHFSDPYVVGTGFKAKFETFKEPLQLSKPGNRTICYNETVRLTALGRGGDVADHAYFWNGVKGGKSITFTATKDTLIYITFGDECMREYLHDSIHVSVRPEITFTQSNDTSICEGQETQLWVKPTGGKNTYDFETSDGSTGSGVSFIYNTGNLTPGTHKYWIRFTDNCTYPDDTAFYTITVGDSLHVTTSEDTTICYGTSATLQANASGGSFGSYLFDWGLGSNATNTFSVQPNIDKTYTVRLSDNCSSFEPTASVTVSVLDSLLVAIQGPDTACYGEHINLTSFVTGGKSNQYTYVWFPGGSTSAIETDILQSTKEYRLTVSDGCTPKSGTSTHIIVARKPLSLITSKDTVLCLGESASMSVTPNGGIEGQHQVTWSDGLGAGLAKTVTPAKPITYHVTLWDRCSDSVSANIRVQVNPLPIVNFYTESPIYCTGLPVQFFDSSSSSPPNNFSWNFGNGETSSVQNPTLVFNSTGLFDVKLKVTNSFGCVDSLSKASFISIIDHPIADFIFSPEDPSFLQSKVEFVNISKHYTSSLWDFGDGISSRDQNSSNSYRDSGLYTIHLRVENSIGCFDEISKSVYVSDDVVIHIPTAFSPNRDGINDDFRPYIRGVNSYDLMIYNRWGEVLFKSTESTKHWDGTANGERAVLGFYFYRLTGIDMNGKEVERNGRFNLIY